MGGRGGSSSGIIPRGGLLKFLSQQDIQRANDASLVDMGDIIKRMFQSGAKEIREMEFSDSDKRTYIKELAELSTTALRAAAGAVNPYVSGPARLTKAQLTGSAADRAATTRGNIENYISKLRDKSTANIKARKNKELATALTAAQEAGKLEIVVDGTRYYRKTKRGKNWYF